MKHPWVFRNGKYERHELIERVMGSDLLISDLDETAAKSPMKWAVYSFLCRPKMLAKPKFLQWCAKAAYNKIMHGRAAESELSREFTETFLRDEKELKRLESIITEEYALKSFYPSALDFYAMLPSKMKKVFVTRSIKQTADVYCRAAGFDKALAEQYDKKASVRHVRSMFPNNRRVIFIGDSKEDEEALDYLKFLWNYVKFDTLLSIYVAKSPEECSWKFDINIGRDYSLLVELLTPSFR